MGRSSCRLMGAAWCLSLILTGIGVAQEQQERQGKVVRPAVPLQPAVRVAARKPESRYELNPQVSPYFAKIGKIADSGQVEVTPPEGMPPVPPQLRPHLVEGYYLGVVQETAQSPLKGARLVRVQVIDVQEEGRAVLQVAPEAATKLKQNEFVMLFRPVSVTTAQMKKLPDLASIEEGAAEEAMGDQAVLRKSFNNLKQIGLALHNFHDAHNRFPPAVINGPNGKPWHSWRVLLLPYLDEVALYNSYHFDEPWDGPHNKKLLEKIPAVFSDPIHGENKDHYTHYVAIRGENMAFDNEGTDFDGENVPFDGGRWIADFTDGTSNTLLVGPASPEQKIPWMKPEDVEFEDSVPDLGKKGSFPTPFRIDGKQVGPFLCCDGRVIGLPEGFSGERLFPMLTRNGGEILVWDQIPTIGTGGAQHEMPVIYIEQTDKGVRARVRMESVPNPPGFEPG